VFGDSSFCGYSAIDRNVDSRDPRGFVGRQEQRRVRDILSLAAASKQGPAAEMPLERGIGVESHSGCWCGDGSWRDRIAADAVWSSSQRQLSRHGDDASLGGLSQAAANSGDRHHLARQPPCYRALGTAGVRDAQFCLSQSRAGLSDALRPAVRPYFAERRSRLSAPAPCTTSRSSPPAIETFFQNMIIWI
jgi:hypothetical protein